MEGTPAIYLGRIVEKKNFRAFIYNADGQKRLVESWEEFEANMESGVWFATHGEAIENKICRDAAESKVYINAKAKPKAKPKPKPKAKPQAVHEVEDVEDVLPDDGTVFEVTDDVLSKEGE